MISFINDAYQLFIEYQSMFLKGMFTTLWLALLGTLFGLMIGFLLAYIRQIKISKQDSLITKLLKKILQFVISFYIEFVRGTPMVAQAVFLYYGLRKAIGWSPLTAGLIIVSFNTAAYMAEIIRGGIQSIDKGQTEAALALGMTKTQTLFSIILPQAIRNAFPSIGNEFVVNIKDTSMLNVIMVSELFFVGMSVAGATYRYEVAMFIIVVIYFLMTTIITRLLAIVEKRLNQQTAEVRI